MARRSLLVRVLSHGGLGVLFLVVHQVDSLCRGQAQERDLVKYKHKNNKSTTKASTLLWVLATNVGKLVEDHNSGKYPMVSQRNSLKHARTHASQARTHARESRPRTHTHTR